MRVRCVCKVRSWVRGSGKRGKFNALVLRCVYLIALYGSTCIILGLYRSKIDKPNYFSDWPIALQMHHSFYEYYFAFLVYVTFRPHAATCTRSSLCTPRPLRPLTPLALVPLALLTRLTRGIVIYQVPTGQKDFLWPSAGRLVYQ